VSSVTLKIDIKVLESDFEKNLEEIENQIERLMKDGKKLYVVCNNTFLIFLTYL
jgi:translation elongation factor EF-1beta